MKRTAGILAAILVTGLSVATPATAQFASVEFMNVTPGGDAAYLELEQKSWKPIHEARVESGKILGWYLYRVLSPSGSSVDHNYVTVAVFATFEAMENPYPDELLAKIVPAQDVPEFTRKTLAAREFVRSETWRLIDRTPDGPLPEPPPYMNVQYMKVPTGGDAAYLEVERIWKNIHAVRVKDDTLASWGLHARVLPQGSDYPYNFGTTNGYRHFEDLIALDFAALVKKANLGMSANELGDRTAEARDLVRGEVWELVDYVQAPPK